MNTIQCQVTPVLPQEDGINARANTILEISYYNIMTSLGFLYNVQRYQYSKELSTSFF